MSKIIIIARKELKDLMRDKRTMLTMIVIPLLIFPLIMGIAGKFTSRQIKKEIEKKIKIAVVGKENALELFQMISENNDIEIINYNNQEIFDSLIRIETLDAAILIPAAFDSTIFVGSTGEIIVKHKSANWGTKDKIRSLIRNFNDSILSRRLKKIGMNKDIMEPVKTNYVDVSTKREKFGKSAGGIIPYVFIIFSFIGCMYPAIDLFTNEKERGTLETILTTPVNRLNILFGKMLVVSLTGLTSALLSILGLSIGMKQFASEMPQEVIGALQVYSDPTTIILLFIMLIPLVIFFAGIMTLITNYARSYKEAQSLISPMMIFVIIPAIIGMMPGMKLNASMALIPIVNISLTAKEIISGTLNYTYYTIVIISLCIYASITVFIAKIWFGKESNILRV